MSNRTVKTSSTASLTPITCTEWCEDGGGHAAATHAEDQYCMSPSWDLETERDESVLSVYREQTPGGPVLVNLSVDGEPGAVLTLPQVELLQDELATIVAQEADAPASRTTRLPARALLTDEQVRVFAAAIRAIRPEWLEENVVSFVSELSGQYEPAAILPALVAAAANPSFRTLGIMMFPGEHWAAADQLSKAVASADAAAGRGLAAVAA